MGLECKGDNRVVRDYPKSRDKRGIRGGCDSGIGRVANAGSSDYFCPLVKCPICGGNDGVCCYMWDDRIPFKGGWREK